MWFRTVGLAALIVAASGCGGGEQEQATPTQPSRPCSTGRHSFQLENGQAAQMLVTPDGPAAKSLIVVLHGAGGTPASALEAFRGGWATPGLVFIAPASKSQTWSILRSEQDVDLESVNFALAQAYKRCRINRRRIGLGGFSDGATYALSLGVSNGDLFPSVMALSPGGVIGGHQVGVPRFFVSHGTLDGVLPIAQAGDAVVKKLRDAGYPVTYRRFLGGHEASEDTSEAAIRWFLAGKR